MKDLFDKVLFTDLAVLLIKKGDINRNPVNKITENLCMLFVFVKAAYQTALYVNVQYRR